MFNIKKQINLLYITSVLGNISITGAWVAILAARGFSLVQIGVAEAAFHITSMIFEIPSGVFADVFGRKKMLLISNIMAIIGNVIMASSNGFGLICASLVFYALSYNLASGSGEALAYDSLKSVNQQERYEKYASNQLIIYRVGSGISTLCAGLALFMGYQLAYLLSTFTQFITLLFAFKLEEIRIVSEEDRNVSINESNNITGVFVLSKILRELLSQFIDSVLFLKNNSKATKLMFANSLVGAIDILLLFFLQAKLPEAGISKWVLGMALLIMELGGIVGSKLILKVKGMRYWKLFAVCLFGVMFGVCLEHTGIIYTMVIGGFISAMADDAIQVRTDAKLQEMFSSEQRATLISISSFTFSVVMIILSPLAGYFFSKW